jgi:hypothetical protein
MDLDGQRLALDSDSFGLVIQYLNDKSLFKCVYLLCCVCFMYFAFDFSPNTRENVIIVISGRLSMSCKGLSTNFIWNQLETLRLESPEVRGRDGFPLEMMKKIGSLPDDGKCMNRRISMKLRSLQPGSTSIIAPFLCRVAPGIVSFRAGYAPLGEYSFITQLNPAKLECLECLDPESPIANVLPLLRAGCPNLKRIRLSAVSTEEWPLLQEALHILSQLTVKLEKLTVYIHDYRPPQGYIAAIKPAAVAHLSTLERVKVGCRAEEMESPCMSLVYGSWGWDKQQWSQLEARSMESIGVPLHKLRVHGRAIFPFICSIQNMVDTFLSREEMETAWKTATNETVSQKAKHLSSALASEYLPVTGHYPLVSFIFEKTLELAKTVSGARPRNLDRLLVQSVLYLVADSEEHRAPYYTQFEALVDSIDRPHESLIELVADTYILRHAPTVLDELLKLPAWFERLREFLNGNGNREPLIFSFIRSKSGYQEFVSRLLSKFGGEIDPNVTNLEGQTPFECFLSVLTREKARNAEYELITAFWKRCPQVCERLSLEKIVFLSDKFGSCLPAIGDIRSILRRDLLEQSLTSDEILDQIYSVYEGWYENGPLPTTNEDYKLLNIVNLFATFLCESLGDASARERIIERLVRLSPE